MRVRLLLCALLATASVAASAEPAPPRVVSMNICTDYVAQLLAAPGQLVSVTWLARDSGLNPLAAEAHAIPINQGTAESVLPLRPAVVLAGVTTTRATVELMRKLGWNVVEVTPASRLDQMPENIRRIARAMQREAAGEALIEVIEAGLAETRAVPAAEPDRVALYAAGGRLVGGDSLAADVVRHVGMTNAGDRFGPFGGALGVEELLRERPALAVSSPYRADRPSLAQNVLSHPALSHASAPPRVEIAAALWSCDGPGVVAAARALKQAAAR
jgi:iron complex transport system substrate-binding protein